MKRIVLTFCTMLLAACAAHRPQEAPLQPAPATEAKPAPSPVAANPNGGQNPVFSPDGSKIAFLSSPPHMPKDLWVMNADGTGTRRLTTKGVNAFRWSADGKSFMITARRNWYEEVLSVDLETGSEKRVPGPPVNASIPLYSPDGKFFAFTAPSAQNVRDLWIGTADGKRVEAVTEKISIRRFFWSPDSRTIYYEAGKSYGMGIWKMDLTDMKAKDLLNETIGTPEYSPQAGLIAFPSPVKPGEFDVKTMKLDGSDIKTYKATRLAGRDLEWDTAGKGVYYLGQDKVTVSEAAQKEAAAEKEKKSATPHESKQKSELQPEGVTALWRLDLATGEEKRISPAGLHLIGFTISPDGKRMVLNGLLEKSYGADLFDFDPASGEIRKLAEGKASSWMPVPSTDSRIAFFTNEERLDTLRVINPAGEELASYPGFLIEGDTRQYWLPASDGFLIFSSRGVFAFTENGPVEFPDSADHRAYLYADVSVQADKVLMSSVPRYGDNAGLYMLEVADGKFVQTDLRYPPAPEMASDVYLQPRWSLDGKKIAFSDGIDIWTMNADGKGRTWLTNYAQSDAEGKAKPSFATFPVWSVKTDKLCYTLTVFDEKATYHELWVVKADGSEPKKLYSEVVESQFQVFQPEYTNQPFFDPSDERIIFTALSGGVPNLFAVEIKTGAIRQLTESGAIFPALIPEEGVIVYTSLEGDVESLWSMNTDGTGKHKIDVKLKKAEPLPAAAEPAKAKQDEPAEKEKAQPAETVK